MKPLLCRSCSAPIMFATTDKGRRIPLDVEPTEQGNVTLGEVDFGGMRRATVLVGLDVEGARLDGRLLYMPHHRTCPEGAAWRKRGNKTMPRQR